MMIDRRSCHTVAVMAVSLSLVTADVAANVLEEVVVIARRVEASMQEVPVAVSAWNAEALSAASVYRLENLNE